MTETCATPGCDNPTATGSQSVLCPKCWTVHRRNLAELPAWIDEANTTLSRQNASGAHNITRRAEPPLPYSQAASDALTALQTALRQWAAYASREYPRILAGNPTTTTLSQRLLTLDYDGWLHTHPDAPTYTTDIHDHHKRLTALVDTDPDLIYRWTCPNGHDVGSAFPEHHYPCSKCGETITQQQLTALVEEHARTLLMTYNEATTALKFAGYKPPTRRDIARWIRRGQLHPAGHDRDEDEPLYRIGDLQHLVDPPQHAARP